MKIVLEDFTYKGKYVDHVEISFPNHIGDYDILPIGKVEESVRDFLDIEVEDEES